MSIPILPANINFTMLQGNAIYKGADWEIDITMANRIAEVDYPIDLQGFVGRCHIRNSALDVEVLATPIVDIYNAEEGMLSLILDEVATAALPTAGSTYKDRARFQYDVILDNESTGETYRILHGYVEVSPQITREV